MYTRTFHSHQYLKAKLMTRRTGGKSIEVEEKGEGNFLQKTGRKF